MPRAVVDASKVLGTMDGLVTLGAGEVIRWSPDLTTSESFPEFAGATCLIGEGTGTLWVCHSGSLWPLDASADPVPLPPTSAAPA